MNLNVGRKTSSDATHCKPKGAVTLGNFSCNLSRKFVAPLRHKLHGSLPGVTWPEMNMSRNVFVAVTVAQSRTEFYFSQRLRQQQKLRDMLISGHVTLGNNSCNFICVATKLQNKLQEKLPSVTAPYVQGCQK